jgi:hypothetical protein
MVMDVRTDNHVLVQYDGWGPVNNEWIAQDSERVAPLGTRARGGKETGGVRDVAGLPCVCVSV